MIASRKVDAIFWITAVVVLLSFVFYAGIGHDAPVRIAWHERFNNQFWDGVLYPKWLPESFAGFGAPTFYFYTPLVFWIGAIFNPVGVFPPEYSNALIAVVGSLLSGFTMYLYLKQYSASKQIVFGLSALYALHPYRSIDVIVRGALSEHFAFIFLPLLFLALDKMLSEDTRSKRQQIFILSLVSWTGLVLTNLPTLAMAVGGGVLYIIPGISKDIVKRSMFFVLGGVLALLLTAFYWLPILELQDAVMLSRLFRTSGEFSKNLFLDLFGPNNKFAATLLFVLISAISVAIYYKRVANTTIQRRWFLIAVAVIILQIPFIQKSLEVIPLFKFVQFSWRWFALLVPFTSFAFLFLMTNKEGHSRKLLVLHSLVNLAIISSTIYLHHFVRLPKTEEMVWYEEPEYMNIYVDSDPDRAYNAFREHKGEPFVVADNPIDEHVQVKEGGVNTYLVNANLPQPTEVTFHHQYFPLWTLQEGNHSVDLQSDSIGRIAATLEAGHHQYVLSLREASTERAGSYVSLVGLMLTATSWLLIRRNSATPIQR